jgi:hypothetical protein
MKANVKIPTKDVALLFLSKITRMLSFGIITVLYFDNLFLKGISVVPSCWLQTVVVVGNIILSQLFRFYAPRIGIVNALMLASVLQFITGVIYA